MILTAIISLSAIGASGAVILYIASKKFEVKENPLTGEVQDVLPAANCGGCGFPGCSGFAAACVNATSLDGLNCPVGGQAVMEKVAAILGLTAGKTDPTIAVLRCNGSCENRPPTNYYDGAPSCTAAIPDAVTAAWAWAIASRHACSTPYILIPKRACPKWTKRNAQVAAPASRLVRNY